MSIDLTLDRIRALYEHLPPFTRPTIHVAGTNGKGSVSALLSSILGASGLSVGRFNSPHLLVVYDSIVVDDNSVDPKAYAVAKELVETASKTHNLAISSFEILTLTALLVFEQARVDFVVMEVGMGGRLDATNVIPSSCIVASVLTAVDLDHQAFLGNTVAEIAREKAAIARPGKPFVLGLQTHPEVEEAVKAMVGDLKLALQVIPRSWDKNIDGPEPALFSLTSPWNAPPPLPISCAIPTLSQPIHARMVLRGDHQLQNLGAALGAIDAVLSTDTGLRQRLTKEAIERGIADTRWPGRLSFHSMQGLPILVDGAHNPASSMTLAKYLTELMDSLDPSRRVSLTFVLALSNSPPKRPVDTLSPLFPLKVRSNVDVNVVSMRFSPPEGMPWIKCEDPSVVRNVLRDLAPGVGVKVVDDAGEEAVRGVLNDVLGREGEQLVVVAGSLYLVADFYRMLDKCL